LTVLDHRLAATLSRPAGSQGSQRPSEDIDLFTDRGPIDVGPILVNVPLEGARDSDGQPVLPLAARTASIR
jgi:hypothetical protein